MTQPPNTLDGAELDALLDDLERQFTLTPPPVPQPKPDKAPAPKPQPERQQALDLN